MKLVIVESPAKAKTISKYLGGDYLVDASGGHVRDLPEKALGVDIKDNFTPTYEITASKKETIKRLSQKIKKAETVYLATDPDREGEAISWHLQEALKLKEGQKNRIVFNEITKKAIQEAIKNPREINVNLVNAQQARRVLDRLVGYKVSPVLCKKIKPKLSAGRVQSAALKILIDREREILAFKPEEYWNIAAFLYKPDDLNHIFKALLIEKNKKKFKITNKDECETVLSEIKGKPYSVSDIKRSQSSSSPPPPFITSTMQQEASSKLNMPSKLTMSVAQNLYEGVDLPDEGHTALVTYIRTDSTRIALEAQVQAKEYLINTYGERYAPERFNVYKTKKNAQDAHEAIRPINLEYTPESLKAKISVEQYKLYKLIYERFLASQSTPAKYDNLTVNVACANYTFRATGKTMTFDGYTRIYAETKLKDDDEENNAKLPDLNEKDALSLDKLVHEQKFTKPPPRYTESTLVKAMEENGIGRPSTYASIISTLNSREYTTVEKKYFVPSELGFTVTEYMESNFNDIVDIEFTALMENKLDLIEDEGADWAKIVAEFYTPLEVKISSAYKSEKVKLPVVESDEVCDKCGSKMLIREGKYGKFLSCSNYPQCNNAKPLNKWKETNEKCDVCGSSMVEKVGKYGRYLACSNYPECKNNRSLQKSVGVCPKCGGELFARRSGRGKTFYGCGKYPQCDYVSWELPAPIKCPKCESVMYVKNEKGTKVYRCSKNDCENTVTAPEANSAQEE